MAIDYSAVILHRRSMDYQFSGDSKLVPITREHHRSAASYFSCQFYGDSRFVTKLNHRITAPQIQFAKFQ
jgi:hypothetical protein